MKGFKIFSVIGLSLIFIGCTGEKESVNLGDVAPPELKQFQIGDTSWQLSLPAGWGTLDAPKGSSGVVLLASRGDVNFVLLQKAGAQFANAQNILSEAQQDFEFFEVINQVENGWTFKGKANSNEPLRTYEQRVVGILGTNNYLYASCSYPIESALGADCRNLVNGVGEVE